MIAPREVPSFKFQNDMIASREVPFSNSNMQNKFNQPIKNDHSKNSLLNTS